MRALNQFVRPLLVLGLLALSGCASSPAGEPEAAGGGAAAEGYTIRVMNQHTSRQEMTIFMVPTGGIRQSLGTVAADATRDFPFSGERGSYRLVAQPAIGSNVTSPSFNVNRPGVYTWDVQLNRVTSPR